MDKKGMTMAVMVSLVLLLLFLVSALFFFKPLYSTDFQLSAEDETCAFTLVLSKVTFIPGKDVPLISPNCHARLITLSNTLVKDYKRKEETREDATTRYLLEEARRCQAVYGYPSRKGFKPRKECYVCSAFQPDKKDPLKILLEPRDFVTYMLQTKTSSGISYARELEDNKHSFAFAFNEDRFVPADRYYALVYTDDVKSLLGPWTPLAGGVATCIVGALAINIIPFIGQAASVLKGAACIGSLVYAGTVTIEVTKGKDLDSLMLTDLDAVRSSCKGAIIS